MGDGLSQDDAQRLATKAAALAMGDWFRDEAILQKRIGQLSMRELEAAVTAGISGWLQERARQQQSENTHPSHPPIGL